MRESHPTKCIVMLYLFTYHVPVNIGSLVKEEYFNCTNPFFFYKEHNYYAVTCVSFLNKSLGLPGNIPTNIHILLIYAESYGSLMIETIDTFTRFPNLMLIEIRIRKGVEISQNLLEPKQLKRLNNELFNLSELKILEIVYLEFNSVNHNWILPSSLKGLHITNSVFGYNLSKCSQLVELLIPQNELIEMPTLSNPLPPLTNLDLSRNPLHKFALADIAKLCDLRDFRLDRNNMSYCECLRVLYWIRRSIDIGEFNFDGILECNYISNQDCSKYPLEEADLLRDECFYGNLWGVTIWIIGMFALLLVIFLVFFLIGYTYIKSRQTSETGEE